MRVIYGYMRQAKKPFVTIYQKDAFIGDSTDTLKVCVLGERELTEREEYEVGENVKLNRRIYCYSSVDELMADDLLFFVTTPQDVVENLRIYEQSCKC